MPPEIVAPLILVGGGLLLALAAVFVTLHASKFPALSARVRECEVGLESAARNAAEAVDIATKARRVTSARGLKRAAAAPAPILDELPHAPRLVTGGPPVFHPGETSGRAPPALTGTEDGGGVVPVEFADDG